jgi:hypothetical protein
MKPLPLLSVITPVFNNPVIGDVWSQSTSIVPSFESERTILIFHEQHENHGWNRLLCWKTESISTYIKKQERQDTCRCHTYPNRRFTLTDT